MARRKENTMHPLVFIEWTRDLEVSPGDEIEYHRGPYVAGKPIAATAFEAASEGLVFLFMHRYGPDDFGYRARRISRRAGKVLAPVEYEF
jgi:hypothetical protein